MLDNYEKFKKDVYVLTKIDLNCYKEKQMRRRIDTLINKNGISSYDAYVDLIKKDKEKFGAVEDLRGGGIPKTDQNLWKESESLECCMFYRRRTIFSSYGFVETDTTC